MMNIAIRNYGSASCKAEPTMTRRDGVIIVECKRCGLCYTVADTR